MSEQNMAINVSNTTAICHDCNKSVANGTLEINLGDWVWASALATGNLFFACAEHHNKMRQWGRQDLPQHDSFTIRQGNRIIGEFRATSMVSEVGMSIVDGEINSQLQAEARKIRRERGY